MFKWVSIVEQEQKLRGSQGPEQNWGSQSVGWNTKLCIDYVERPSDTLVRWSMRWCLLADMAYTHDLSRQGYCLITQTVLLETGSWHSLHFLFISP